MDCNLSTLPSLLVSLAKVLTPDSGLCFRGAEISVTVGFIKFRLIQLTSNYPLAFSSPQTHSILGPGLLGVAFSLPLCDGDGRSE